MPKVTLLMLKPSQMGNLYEHGMGFQLEVARADTCYYPVEITGVSGELDGIPEEMFDLLNNPWRQAEREERYGRGRSLSIGDIVDVDGARQLCCSFGWRSI